MPPIIHHSNEKAARKLAPSRHKIYKKVERSLIMPDRRRS